MERFANAKAIEITAAGRIQPNLSKADLYLNFPLSIFNFQLNRSLFNALPLIVKVC